MTDPYLARLYEDIEAECLALLAAESRIAALRPLSPYEQALARVYAGVSYACRQVNEFISDAFWPMAKLAYIAWIIGLCLVL